MDERAQIIISNIDNLIKKCDQRVNFSEIKNEIEFLIQDLIGKDSKEYKKFTEITFYIFADKYIPTKSLLSSIKNHIILYGLSKQSKSMDNISIHPSLYKVSSELFNNGHYTQAVEVSIKEIISRLKNLYKKYYAKDIRENDLISQVFDKDINKTLLMAGGNLKTQSEIDEQDGYKFLLMGMWKALRNPNAHENKFMSIHEATNQLHFLSMLMYKIDICVARQKLEE